MPRPTLLAITPWPILGAVSSAPRRMLSYLRERADEEEVTILALTEPGTEAVTLEEAGISEIRVPMTRGHGLVRQGLVQRFGPPADLLALESAGWLTPAFGREMLARRSAGSVVTVSALAVDVRLRIGRAPDVVVDRSEYLARRDCYAEESAILQRLARFEDAALSAASAIIVPSGRDGELLGRLYDLNSTSVHVHPPSMNCFDDRPAPLFADERRARKAGSTLAGSPIASFAASEDPANIVLVQRIISLAATLPNVLFLIVGAVAGHFDRAPVVPNVRYTGAVPNLEFDQIMEIVDVGLDPAPDGAARGVRALDYARRGVPVVATPHAARLLPKFSTLAVPFSNMPAAIARLANDNAAADVISTAAYRNCGFGRFAGS